MEVHIVVKGDTLWKIARQHNIPFEELKRVNAHLANPDYIVPGMKIFLPMDKKQPISKGEPPAHHEKPQTKPAPQKPHEKLPEKPIKPEPPAHHVPPLPQTPQKPTKPIEQKPSPSPIPPAQPMPPQPPIMHQPNMPAVPMWQAVFPVCGWVPIFDADCHPHLPHQPMPQLPVHHQPAPPAERPTPAPKPAPKPEKKPLPDGWQLVESSSLHMIKPLPKPELELPKQILPLKPFPLPEAKPQPQKPSQEMKPQPEVKPQPPQEPPIPPKACTPPSWCPSNQCNPYWPVPNQPDYYCQPVQWLPMYPPMYPTQFHPGCGCNETPQFPMPAPIDWQRNS